MDVRTSRLIVVAYLAIGSAVALACFIGYERYLRHAVQWSGLSKGNQPSTAGAEDRIGRFSQFPSRISRRQGSVEVEMQRTQKLKALLNRREALLLKQGNQLEASFEENKQLRQEAENYLAALVDLFANDLISGHRAVMGEDASDQVEDVAATRAANSALQTELERVTMELEQARIQLVELENVNLREMEQSDEWDELMSETGRAVVPSLVVMLTDDRPETRRWAAFLLGRIGPAAVDATDALMFVLDDDNSEVRREARKALSRINREY